MERIVIIGGTAAGTSAAAKARRLIKDQDASITIYERRDIVSFGACGLPYFVGGEFDDEREMLARTPAEFIKSGVSVETGHTAVSLDVGAKRVLIRNLATNAEEAVSYDKLVIATGAEAGRLGSRLEGFQLRTLEDGKKLRAAMQSPANKSVAIIGAGSIGLELSTEALALGKRVSLFDLKPVVGAGAFDPEISSLIEKALLDAGVTLRLGVNVSTPSPRSIVWEGGSLEADIIVASTGISPSTGWLDGSGIALGPEGAIITNALGETNLPNVWAAGDCAMAISAVTGRSVWAPLAGTANKTGRVVGENLAGRAVKHPGTLQSTSLLTPGLEAARTGLNLQDALKAGYSAKSVLIEDMDHASYYPGQTPVHVKLIFDSVTGILLGAQIAGAKNAVLRMHALSVAIAKRVTVEELGLIDFAYSPPFSRTWDVLNVAGNVASK